MEQILDVRGLTKAYPGFLLDHVSFSLNPGRITGLIGRNGAGKTTTLHSLLSFTAPDTGEIRFWGKPLQENALEIRQKIGFVSAGMHFYGRKKLRRITAVTRDFYAAWDDALYRHYLQTFSLDEEKTPDALSNGMKIKYMLALALSHGAELLILDEPTSGLDPFSREELLEIFLNLAGAGKTILFSTHITSDLDKTADDILYLSGGKLRAADTLRHFRESWRLVSCPDAEAPGMPLIGARRAKEGFTALIPAEAAPDCPFPSREATLEELMVHLEKEADTCSENC